MTVRMALLLSLLLPLAACTRPQTPASPDTAEATAPAQPAATASAPEAAPAAAPEAAAEPAPAATPDIPVGPAPVAGVDYVEIAGGQPFEPGSGRIEVVEVFSYTCPHCASFEPLVRAWRARQPADVKFTPVAGYFGGNPEPFARAYYAAEAMGLLGRTHEPMFRAIHIERTLPLMGTDNARLAAFYAQYGADPQQFASTMTSFAVEAKLKRANQFILRSGVEGSPSVIVNGKYRVTGKTLEDTLRITTHLVAKERAAHAS